MKRIMIAAIAGIVVLNSVIAGEAYKWAENPDTLKKQWGGKYAVEKVPGAPGDAQCLVVDNINKLLLKKFIPVDPAKTYTLSGQFKSLGKVQSRVFFGFVTYDKNKKYIQTINSNVISGTYAELAAPAKAGDKSLTVKNAVNWKAHRIPRFFRVAFNAKKDFSDLPNYDTSLGIKKVEKKDDVTVAELTGPLKKSYPAGTGVRVHHAGCGFYLYSVLANQKIPAEWKQYSKKVTVADSGQAGGQYFRQGTAFVQILILANFGQKKDAKLAITEIKLTDSEAK